MPVFNLPEHKQQQFVHSNQQCLQLSSIGITNVNLNRANCILSLPTAKMTFTHVSRIKIHDKRYVTYIHNRMTIHKENYVMYTT